MYPMFIKEGQVTTTLKRIPQNRMSSEFKSYSNSYKKETPEHKTYNECV